MKGASRKGLLGACGGSWVFGKVLAVRLRLEVVLVGVVEPAVSWEQVWCWVDFFGGMSCRCFEEVSGVAGIIFVAG